MKFAFLIYQYSDNRVSCLPQTSTNGRGLTLDSQKNSTGTSSAGGVERYTADLAHVFVDMGHEVHLFCHKRKGVTDERILFHHVPAIGFWSPLKIWSFAIVSFLMLRKRRCEFDIIHGFGKTFFQDVLRLGGGSHFDYMRRTYPRMGNRFFRFFIILNPRHLFNLLLEWVMFRTGGTKRKVCNSNMCKREYMERYGVSENVIDVIYNGVDSERFSPVDKKMSRERVISYTDLHKKNITGDETFVLFVGSGFRRKGLKHAIESLAFVDKKINIHLLVVGRGNFDRYREMAQNLGISNMVTYLGAVDNAKELYDACDIFLFPTEYDAFPNVCLEAMSMTLPVIVSRSCGAAEIIEDGIDGLIIDYPIDPKEISGKIERLLDCEERVRMGMAARNKALNYSVKANAEKTLDLYGEVLRRPVTV